jgi:hypothetical protein
VWLLLTLAKEVCHCTVAELSSRLSLAEYRLWKAYYADQGSDLQRADLQAAVVAHTVAHGAGYAAALRRRRRGWKIGEFMPFRDPSEHKPDPRRLAAKLQAFVGLVSGSRQLPR